MPKTLTIVLIYPVTLEKKVITTEVFNTEEEIKRYYKTLYPSWKVLEVKEVTDDEEGS